MTLTQAGGQPAITYGWPCNPCGPIGSLIISTVHYNAPGNDMTNPNGEYIVIKNVGGSTVDLMDWTVINDSYQISSKISRLVAPGGTVKIYIGSGSNTSSKLYWGKSHGILGNGGDEVILKTPFRDVASCYSWGTGSC